MIYTVTGEVQKADFGNACIHEHICVVSNDYCIYSDFTDGKNTGIEKTIEEHIHILNYHQERIYPALKGSEDDWRRMTRQNIVDVLDI